MFDSKIIEVLFIAFFGPLVVLTISRHIEKRRFIKERQLRIFRMLMAHRNIENNLEIEFVQALNLIPIEFNKEQKVLEARRKLQECYEREFATNRGEYFFTENIKKLTTMLLMEIAKVLKIEVEWSDIHCEAYTPQAWIDSHTQEKEIKEKIRQVLNGERAIHIVTQQSQQEDSQ